MCHTTQARSFPLLILLLLCSRLLISCGENSTPTAPPATATSVAPTNTIAQATATIAAPTATTKPAPTAPPTLGPNQFKNPVIAKDFPDPDVLKVGDTYYAFATNSGSFNIQAAKSTDLVNWSVLSDALPVLPAWAEGGNTWAPEVTTWDGGKSFVLYFAARIKNGGSQCIGVATATAPIGPFKSASDQPFICDLGEGGDIDPASFIDQDGSHYVLWKNDGNCCGSTTWLYIQKVSADGLTREGERTQLVKDDQGWEGIVVEAPTLWKSNGKYYLFYSANAYNTLNYAVGYAMADNILGPYTKGPDPILSTNLKKLPTAIGPGGQDIVTAPNGQTWIVYHSWDGTITNRSMDIDEIDFSSGVPVVKGPDMLPQDKPQ